jgi:holo-[acyl-carrier protein] synthase
MCGIPHFIRDYAKASWRSQLMAAKPNGLASTQPKSQFKMSVIGTGVDLVECARIERSIDRFGDRFLHRVFTKGEIEYSMSMKFPARHLAARFAAKEAVSKAFGTGIGKAMGWRDIDIQKKPSGEPFLVLFGPAQELAKKRGVTSALITLSHTEHHAMASVVLESTGAQSG